MVRQDPGGKDKASLATLDVNWTQTLGSDQSCLEIPKYPT